MSAYDLGARARRTSVKNLTLPHRQAGEKKRALKGRTALMEIHTVISTDLDRNEFWGLGVGSSNLPAPTNQAIWARVRVALLGHVSRVCQSDCGGTDPCLGRVSVIGRSCLGAGLVLLHGPARG